MFEIFSALRRRVRGFLADTRAAAGVMSVLVTVASLGATALIVDHLWLTDQRDTTKLAADAAVTAATLEMEGLTDELSEEDRTRVAAVARRYAVLNIVGNTPSATAAQVRESIEVDVPSSAGGRVDVIVRADLGSTLLSGGLLGYAGPGSIEQRAAVQPSLAPTELVFAFDVSKSMASGLGGGGGSSRMEVVKQAATDLLDVLQAAGTGGRAPFAVGLVPWHHHVRLGEAARAAWEANGWAAYPTARDYPYPPAGERPSSPAHPVAQTLPAKSSLPSMCAAWEGCLDLRADQAALPSASPFTMRFFSPDPTYYAPQYYVSFECQAYNLTQAQTNGWWAPVCYDWSLLARQLDSWKCGEGWAHSAPEGAPIKLKPQEKCSQQPAILPLTTDLDAARTAIGALAPIRGRTNSTMGVAWAHRLLAPEWRDVWGGGEHPMASTEERALKKVLVLLTDGEDNHPDRDRSGADASRAAACAAVKEAGVLVFTISAMNTSTTGHAHLAAQLQACSSQSDDPDGTYAFVNNATSENLAEAFREISRQLLVMRRVR